MIKSKHIITALPLIASVLGRKYGVQVVIGGSSAHTDGKTIFLPSLPADGDENLLNLARGFIDHESAHLRETDFSVGRKVTPLEHHICNILEDWRVEKILANIFPGCKHNLTWLARHFLLDDQDNVPSSDQAQAILLWLLLTVYSWSLPELLPQLDVVTKDIGNNYPGLLCQLEPIMQSVPQRCTSTQRCLEVAKEIVKLLRKYHYEGLTCDNQQESSDENNSSMHGNAKSQVSPENMDKLKQLINSGKSELPSDLGKRIAVELTNIAVADTSDNHITVAVRNIKNT